MKKLIQTWVTELDYNDAKDQAETEGMTLAGWVRKLIKNAPKHLTKGK